MTDKSRGFLSDFTKALDEMAETREKERAEFNVAIGEPAVFVPDPEVPGHGVGFWKAEGGVLAYRKYHNGYDPFSRTEYPDSLIDVLNVVRRK